jgi:glucose-6-phosphate isomerase
MKLCFVANVDGADFARKVEDGLNPEETLFIIISKTFTTAETMMNAHTAREWMLGRLDHHPETVKKHFVAVSTNLPAVAEFGIDSANVFGFWDWVGGRFSVSSAVGGVPLALYLGYENFENLLAGAHLIDRHFLETPFAENIPVNLGLLAIWNNDFLGYNCQALLPYSQALQRFAPHIQQVDMESNGKRVDLQGRVMPVATGPVIFGEPGTNGQHSFYQLLHQGQIVPADFIGFIKPQYQLGKKSPTSVDHHQELMSNFFAQPDALAFGKTEEELRKEGVPEFLIPHKTFPGNRPTSLLLFPGLTPKTTGMLLAIYEHRTAVQGFIWGIDSFDQWGVELGKVLGKSIRQRMIEYNRNPAGEVSEFNPATNAMLQIFLDGNREGEV